ncbi:molybdopterin-binding protein [Nocardia harenae]|uniref:molybdopterin-binding protein n=1 Tax=Nocardia harenae TaxID=358707 RepID=UPI00083007C1|nr:molybdopterin-binding protein [Nocardia harenae]
MTRAAEPGTAVAVAGIAALLAEGIAALAPRACSPAAGLRATLAADLVTATALPLVDTAAMDGYAVAGAGPWVLRSEVVRAGHPSSRTLAGGTAVRIATGAPTPRGTTAVLRSEVVRLHREGQRATVVHDRSEPARDDTRRAGEHWPQGQLLAAAGTRVCPAVVSAAASAEAVQLWVRGPVEADVVLTGDEIRTDAGPLRHGQTRDSLAAVLPEYLRAVDIGCAELRHLPDCPDLLSAWLGAEQRRELVIMVGATGRGSADHLRAALAALGARVLLDGVGLRPGGSQLVAVLPGGQVLLALPGNPLAAVAALLVTAPAIVDALTARSTRARRYGRVTGAAMSGTVARAVPVRQLPGGVWQSIGAVQTPHLAGLIGADALALLDPAADRGGPVELLLLPR